MCLFRSRITIFRIFYYSGKVFGLCPFNVNQNHEVQLSKLGIIYNVSLSILYAIIGIEMLSIRVRLKFPKKTTLARVMDSVAAFFHCLAVLGTWLQLAFKQNQINQIVKDLNKSKEFVLNSKKNYFKNLFFHILVGVCFYSILDVATDAVLSVIMQTIEEKLIFVFNFFQIFERIWIIFLANFFSVMRKNFWFLNKQIRKWCKEKDFSRYSS